MDANKSSSQFPVPGVALVLIALGIFVYNDNPFNPTRPDTTSNNQSTAEDVRARLWQDPFNAVQHHRNSFDVDIEKNELKTESLKSVNEFIYQDEKHIVCTTPGDTLDDTEKAHSYGELGCRINNDTSAELHMLAVMVPGGNYAEDNETRIRSRYAVVSALSKANYIPSDAEHIGFMNFASLCKSAIKEKSPAIDKSEDENSAQEFCRWPAIIPYEWFVNKTKEVNRVIERKTLVLWVDDSVVARKNPLRMLNSLRSLITQKSGEKSYSFDVVGPASSTTLIKMYEEAYASSCVSGDERYSEDEKKCADPLVTDYETHDIKIYSSKATMDEIGINKYISNKDNADTGWLQLIKTIPSDDKLVEAMLNELLRRGINPYRYEAGEADNINSTCKHYSKNDPIKVDDCKDIEGIEFNGNKKQDHIVLVGEWDTVYSRNFNDLFRRNIQGGNDDERIEWLHSYNYLRGIDGATGYGKNKDKKKSDEKGDGKEIRRPVGENQYDYLRNIGDQITHLNASLIDGKVRAIGIVGSDTYDKLLVLQALRDRFQDVVFFTTDLDSRMLHKSENKWARNLVVASGFGLSPKDESQHEITTFRDSYQTSLYLSILNAINFSPQRKSKEYECNVTHGVTSDVFGNAVKAKIFEIGNDQAVDYSPDYCDKENTAFELPDKFYRYAGLFAGFFLLVFYQASYTSRVILLISVSILGAVSVLAFFADAQGSIEYKAMFSGTSIWPAILIRLSAALIALAFIFYTLKCMKRNTNEIIKKYDLERSIESCTVSIKDMVLIDTWGGKKSRLPPSNVNELMCQYLNLASFRKLFPRVLIMTALYMGLSICFMKANGMAYTPFHGGISASLSQDIIRLCVILYLFLVFLVVDITRLYARFVKLLSNTHVSWSETMTDKYCLLYGVTKEIAEEKLKLNLIVHRSRIVDVLIFLPFVILSLMIISRSSYFDRWYMPVGLAMVIVFGALFALSSAIRLRRTAESARKNVLSKLEILHKQQVYKEAKREFAKSNPDLDRRDFNADLKGTDQDRKDLDLETKADNPEEVKKRRKELCEYKLASRLQNVIDEIRNIKDGPFSPITQHPIFSAVAMPFGGVGSLYLIDYVANIGV